MKYLPYLFTILILNSCDFGTSAKNDRQLNRDLASVTDSISKLMSEYHYNPSELATGRISQTGRTSWGTGDDCRI